MAAVFLSGSLYADSLTATTPYVPTSHYEILKIEGWKVRVNRDLLGPEKKTGDKALALLRKNLHEIREEVPENALSKLQRVTIWLGVDDYAAPGAVYHPNPEWLREHGWNPDKGLGIELGSAATFIEWSKDQPMMVMHELAHAYYHQVFGDDIPEVRRAYERAKRSGRYDAVVRNNGNVETAYAMNNEFEYFAESSEAFFGQNDFQPFDRHELKAFDPEMYRVLEDVWNR